MKKDTAKMAERATLEDGTHTFTLCEHIARYVFAGKFVAGKSILDIACGTGYGSSYLFNKGANTVVGADYSDEALEYGRLHYQKDGLEFIWCDAQQMVFPDNSFDVIVSFETIEHLERYEDYLKECKRVLKADGTFICSTPNIDGGFGYKNPWHLREFSLIEFNELMSRYFGEVVLYGQTFIKKEEEFKKESIKRLAFIIRLIPMPIKNFLKKLILPEQFLFTSLSEVCPGFADGVDDALDKKYAPSLLNQSSPLCRIMIAVAKKRVE